MNTYPFGVSAYGGSPLPYVPVNGRIIAIPSAIPSNGGYVVATPFNPQAGQLVQQPQQPQQLQQLQPQQLQPQQLQPQQQYTSVVNNYTVVNNYYGGNPPRSTGPTQPYIPARFQHSSTGAVYRTN